MSNANAGHFLAKSGSKKPAADFSNFAKNLSGGGRANFAYDMRNGLSNTIDKSKTPIQIANELLVESQTAMRAKDFQRAITILYKALEISPESAEIYLQLGDCYSQTSATWDNALKNYMEALRREPTRSLVHTCIGTLLMRMQKRREAIDFFEMAVQFDPENTIALSRMLHLKGFLLDWSGFEKINQYAAHLKKTRVPIDPFAVLPIADDGDLQLVQSKKMVASLFSKNSADKIASKPFVEGQKIRIGYFSNDFYDHATMHLMGGLLDTHDRDAFELYLYDYGSKVQDHETERARNNADVFRDVRSLNTEALVKLAREDALDIAIDLKGFTEGGRLDFFSRRIAPVQVTYLGYPGSTALKEMDYMIADEVTIPTQLRKHYVEKIAYLPQCYQPNDDRRVISETGKTRADLGLPEDKFVFGSFNNPYKVTPREFDIWMKLLREVPDSVLWFFEASLNIIDTVRAEAEKRGVSGDRIIPAGSMTPADHLERVAHADVFLDTFAVNAHTTASDCLWAGVPVVTKIGEQFAARVAGSIVTSAGLEDLIATTDREYHDILKRLATDKAYHAEIKARVKAAQESAELYDTKGYTRNYEALLTKLFRNAQDGNSPRHTTL